MAYIFCVQIAVFGCATWIVFCQVPDAFQNLIHKVEATMKHAIEEEEGIPLASVTNFKEVCNIQEKTSIFVSQPKWFRGIMFLNCPFCPLVKLFKKIVTSYL